MAALAAAFALTGCGLSVPEIDKLFGQTAEVSSHGAETADDYSAEASGDAEVTGMLTLQALLGEDSSDAGESAVDYTDPYAWEYCYQYLDEPRQQWYRDIQRILAGMGQEQALSDQGLEAGLNE